MTQGDRWGAVAQNEYYTGSRLTYQRSRDVEVELVDWASGKKAFWVLLRAFGGAFLINSFFGLLAVAIAAYREVSGGGDLSEALVQLFFVLSFLLALVWLAVALFLPRVETLSEWQLLLDAKARLAETAYGVVHRALIERQAPVEIEPVARAVTFPHQTTRNFLQVTLLRYQVIVSVFPFGWDLYLGWTMMRREVPIKVVFRWLRSLVSPGSNYDDLIDLEPVRALREAVHNAMRQGIEAAAGQPFAGPGGTLGDEQPVRATYGP